MRLPALARPQGASCTREATQLDLHQDMVRTAAADMQSLTAQKNIHTIISASLQAPFTHKAHQAGTWRVACTSFLLGKAVVR